MERSGSITWAPSPHGTTAAEETIPGETRPDAADATPKPPLGKAVTDMKDKAKPEPKSRSFLEIAASMNRIAGRGVIGGLIAVAVISVNVGLLGLPMLLQMALSSRKKQDDEAEGPQKAGKPQGEPDHPADLEGPDDQTPTIAELESYEEDEDTEPVKDPASSGLMGNGRPEGQAEPAAEGASHGAPQRAPAKTN